MSVLFISHESTGGIKLPYSAASLLSLSKAMVPSAYVSEGSHDYPWPHAGGQTDKHHLISVQTLGQDSSFCEVLIPLL